jgi:phage terminase large subunit
MPKLSEYIDLQPTQKKAMEYIGKGYRIFFGGSRGGGKSYLALASAIITAIRYPNIRIMIVRQTYPELEEVFIAPMLSKFPEHVFKYKYRKQQKIAVFDNGSRLIFKAIASSKDAEKAQGVEFQYLIIDEAPNFDDYIITKLMGSLRSTIDSTFIPTLLMTGNPGGVSDMYFKTRFIRPNYTRWTEGELLYKDKYIFIESKVKDNKYLSEEYINTLKSLPEHLRKAWLDGDWDVFEGTFFENWQPDKNVIPAFPIPEHWQRVAGFDLGFSSKHPSVCLWTAQDPETNTVYVYREYASTQAVETIIRDLIMLSEDEQFVMFVDPSMFTNNRRYEYDESYGNMFLNSGLPVLPANNDRINGWRIVKAWMESKLKIFDCCPGLIETIPTLRYTPYGRGKKEDLDTNMSDDFADALRYALTSGYGYPIPLQLPPDEKINNDIVIQAVERGETLEHTTWLNKVTIRNVFY